MNKACSRFVTREGKVRSRGAISGETAIKISVAHLQNATLRRVPPLEQVQLSDSYDTVDAALTERCL